MTQTLHTIRTVTDLKKVAADLGSHWFDRAAFDFFKSRMESKLYPTGSLSGYFVSSEQDDPPYAEQPEPRLYTVREYRVEGDRIEIGTAEGHEFQEFEAAAEARAAARLLQFKAAENGEG